MQKKEKARMAKAVFKAREFTVKAKGSKEFVSEEMVRAKLFAARKKKEVESMSVFAAIIKPEKVVQKNR